MAARWGWPEALSIVGWLALNRPPTLDSELFSGLLGVREALTEVGLGRLMWMMCQVNGDCLRALTLPVPSVLSADPQLLLTPACSISHSKELLSLSPCTLSCTWGPWGQGWGAQPPSLGTVL